MIGVDLLGNHLGLGPDVGPVDASALEVIEAGVVAYVENETGRQFRAPGSLVHYYHGTASQVLELRVPVSPSTPPIDADGPIVSIRTGNTDIWQEQVSVSVIPHPRLGINNLLFLDRGGLWPVGNLNIKVEFRGGYTAGREPADIRLLVTSLSCLRFTGKPAAVAVTPSSGEGSEIPANLREIIDRWTYRRGVSTTQLVRA